ncbi:hypothetical protein CATMIT_01618, partial [Catenibacterium mitsuokai DSM 15897]
GQFSKGPCPTPMLDGARYALRQQQPPRNDVAVPRVDDGLHILIEEIAVYDHGMGAQWWFGVVLHVGLPMCGRMDGVYETFREDSEPARTSVRASR